MLLQHVQVTEGSFQYLRTITYLSQELKQEVAKSRVS